MAANHSFRWRSLLPASSFMFGVLLPCAELDGLADGRCTAAACLCCTSSRPTSAYKFG